MIPLLLAACSAQPVQWTDADCILFETGGDNNYIRCDTVRGIVYLWLEDFESLDQGEATWEWIADNELPAEWFDDDGFPLVDLEEFR